MNKIDGNFKGMAYQTIGPASAPALFLLHPLGGSRESFSAQYDFLSQHFKLVIPELAGHGQSDSYGTLSTQKHPLNLSDLADWVIALADHLHIPAFHFLGISIGGMIGQALGLNHSSRILSLALCNTSSIMPEENMPFWDEIIKTAQEKGVSALGEGFMERFFTPDFYKTNAQTIHNALNIFNQTKTQGFIDCVQAIKGLSFQEDIKKITLPVLVTGARQDTALPLEAAEFIANTIPNARLVVFENTSHLSQIQEPEAFNQALENFYRDTF